VQASAGRAGKVLLVGLIAWWGPIALVVLTTGLGSVYSQEGVFFSQVAVITFGGAYAVLAYVGQEVVTRFSVATTDVVAGLGLAESTPGPLIMVVQFLGFLAAYRDPGSLPPVVAGTLGALVTVWATFAPCFLWIFLGAPFIEQLRGNRALNGALAAVTAAVVGVILNLAVTFGLVALFDRIEQGELANVTFPVPHLSSVDGFAALLAVAGFLALWRFKVNVLWVIGASAAAGLVYRAVT